MLLGRIEERPLREIQIHAWQISRGLVLADRTTFDAVPMAGGAERGPGQLGQLVEELRQTVGGLEPDVYRGSDAARLVELFAEVEKLVSEVWEKAVAERPLRPRLRATGARACTAGCASITRSSVLATPRCLERHSPYSAAALPPDDGGEVVVGHAGEVALDDLAASAATSSRSAGSRSPTSAGRGRRARASPPPPGPSGT